jgi:2,3-bisphosphoglycerate-independent phosphoglycerate mutase
LIFLIILDGAQENNMSALNGGAPVKAAYIPQLDKIIRHGMTGEAEFFTSGREADSLTCILTMLGVPADWIPASRAPLEALGAGIEVEENELVYRCNVVSTENGRLSSFNGGRLSREKMKAFAAEAACHSPPGIRLFHLSDYRNLLVVKNGKTENPADSLPPQQSIGLPVFDLLSRFSLDRELLQFIDKSKEILPGYMFYPWGAGVVQKLPQFRLLTGHTAACVCRAEIMAGIAKGMGMEVSIPPHATGDFDTDLKEKARAALGFAGRCGTVVIHVNGTDELAHRRDLNGKIRFIEKIDTNLIGTILSETREDIRFIVTSDHVTSSETGRHEKLPVKWVCADYYADAGIFSAPPAQAGLTGRRLVHKLLQGGKS